MEKDREASQNDPETLSEGLQPEGAKGPSEEYPCIADARWNQAVKLVWDEWFKSQ